MLRHRTEGAGDRVGVLARGYQRIAARGAGVLGCVRRLPCFGREFPRYC
jgi:hypothetical protein